jgi:aspartyl-tRNA(Asn)/glutamyl-tRNA(Gln) amidotransferase subunit B
MKRALETCIGLEIHAQLNTHKKLFSGAPFDAFGAPNAQLAYFDAALPGAMPV